MRGVCLHGFDPTGPCTADGRVPGAYPALEAQVPKALGRAARRHARLRPELHLDGARDAGGHGVDESASPAGLVAPWAKAGVDPGGLQRRRASRPEWLGEWYEAERAGRARTRRQITPTRPKVAGQQGYRLDTINGDSNQTVIDLAFGDPRDASTSS